MEALLKTVSWEVEALLEMRMSSGYKVESLLKLLSTGYEVEASLIQKWRIKPGMRWRYCW